MYATHQCLSRAPRTSGHSGLTLPDHADSICNTWTVCFRNCDDPRLHIIVGNFTCSLRECNDACRRPALPTLSISLRTTPRLQCKASGPTSIPLQRSCPSVMTLQGMASTQSQIPPMLVSIYICALAALLISFLPSVTVDIQPCMGDRGNVSVPIAEEASLNWVLTVLAVHRPLTMFREPLPISQTMRA